MSILALIVLLFVVGVAFRLLLPTVRRIEQGDSGPNPDVLRLQQAIDDLSARLILVEEETEFYRKLRAPEDPPQIEPGPPEE